MPGKKLLFMGGEIGQWHEWNHNAEIDWALMGHHHHDGIRRLIGDLNRLYRDQPALHEADVEPKGFQWITCDDADTSVYAYTRQAQNANDFVVVALNMTPVPRHNYKLGVPIAGFYTEILNTDASIYGGSNLGNAGGVYSQTGASHGRQQYISLTLPPLAALVMKPVTGREG
jgi:1,4-alpha-glucan branching enzyme